MVEIRISGLESDLNLNQVRVVLMKKRSDGLHTYQSSIEDLDAGGTANVQIADTQDTWVHLGATGTTGASLVFEPELQKYAPGTPLEFSTRKEPGPGTQVQDDH